jgi:hypothetical protein
MAQNPAFKLERTPSAQQRRATVIPYAISDAEEDRRDLAASRLRTKSTLATL